MPYYAFVCIITPFYISSYINDNFKHPYKSESQNGHIIEDRLFANKTEMKLGFKCILIFCRYKDTQKKNETPDDNTHDMCFTLSYNVQALRYLVDTTCLELAKPANTFYRLSCSEPANYHCLLVGISRLRSAGVGSIFLKVRRIMSALCTFYLKASYLYSYM